MTGRVPAYSAYAVGSVVFLSVALSRGSWLIATGSALFLLGTLLLLGPLVGRLTRGRVDQPDHRR